jgi:hypothetical protein
VIHQNAGRCAAPSFWQLYNVQTLQNLVRCNCYYTQTFLSVVAKIHSGCLSGQLGPRSLPCSSAATTSHRIQHLTPALTRGYCQPCALQQGPLLHPNTLLHENHSSHKTNWTPYSKPCSNNSHCWKSLSTCTQLTLQAPRNQVLPPATASTVACTLHIHHSHRQRTETRPANKHFAQMSCSRSPAQDCAAACKGLAPCWVCCSLPALPLELHGACLLRLPPLHRLSGHPHGRLHPLLQHPPAHPHTASVPTACHQLRCCSSDDTSVA